MTGVPGGAGQGVETAGIVFRNVSARRCTVRGYPFAQLRHAGKPLGAPAGHPPGTGGALVLAPRAAAHSLLSTVTTCQAAVSDHARVRAPGSTVAIDILVQLRGCSLRIAALQPG